MRFHTVLLAGMVGVYAAVAGAQAVVVKDEPFTATWTRVTKFPSGMVRTSQLGGSLVLDPPTAILIGPQAGESRLDPTVNPFDVAPPAALRYNVIQQGSSGLSQGEHVREETVVVARASDGSIYKKSTSNDHDPEIVIYDVPHGRMIYATSNRLDIRKLPLKARSVEEERAILERVHQPSGKTAGKETVAHTTALGVKTEDGMTLFGQKFDSTTKRDGKTLTSESESWMSDTGLTTLMSYNDSQGKTITEKLETYHAGEPDAKLFKVPKVLP
jgi:hypothetical protein